MLMLSLYRKIFVTSYLSSVFLSSKFPLFFYNIFHCLLLFRRVFNHLSFQSFLVFPPLLYVKTNQSPSLFLLFTPSYLHLLFFSFTFSTSFSQPSYHHSSLPSFHLFNLKEFSSFLSILRYSIQHSISPCHISLVFPSFYPSSFILYDKT